MFRVTILFKSGNSLIVYADEFKTAYNGDTLTKLQWTGLSKGQQFLHIDLSEIECVTCVPVAKWWQFYKT